jgi:hypothetical protein
LSLLRRPLDSDDHDQHIVIIEPAPASRYDAASSVVTFPGSGWSGQGHGLFAFAKTICHAGKSWGIPGAIAPAGAIL